MLAIDDVRKLAKMKEVLLERSINDREVNLEEYKSIVKQIDAHDFSNLLSEIQQIDDHNQTLEDELQFLEHIKSSYQQLLEQQFSFRRVCELYGNSIFQLSDLSQLNIEYIDDRINVISGYLINRKNIKDNETKLGRLNEQLIEEEKNRNFLCKKLGQLENELRDNFINAEGRFIVDGQLQYVNVISEYKELGYDFKLLLNDIDTLNNLLSEVNTDRIDTEEKLRTAEICYENVPSVDSKQIYDEIDKEYLKIKYRLTMLKILEMLSKNYDNYDLFKKKREDLIDLIKYRFNCLERLGVHISVDPFSRTRVAEQFDIISSLKDNSKDIARIKKEIVDLNERLEQMVAQNSIYIATIRNTEDLVLSRTSINDINITGVTWDVDEYFEEETVLENQVVGIKNIPRQFNMGIVSQKTGCVIRRVNEMVNAVSLEKNDSGSVLSPELVIVPLEEPVALEKINGSLDDEGSIVEQAIDVSEKQVDEKLQQDLKINNPELFMTVSPFVEATLFTDRSDEDDTKEINNIEVSEKDDNDEINDFELNEVIECDTSNLDDINGLEDEMPDAFWIIQEDNSTVGKEKSNENDGVVLSFDEQIKLLRLEEDTVETNSSKNKSKILKFNNDVDRKVA